MIPFAPILWILLKKWMTNSLRWIVANPRLFIILVFSGIIIWYINSLQSQIKDYETQITNLTAQVSEQRAKQDLLVEEAKKNNGRTIRTTRQIRREAQNAKTEDNAPFNPALLGTLERLRTLDQSRRTE